ncbi:GGDEF domain-containing protein [Gluconacetobacter tumulicola]|uniref:diguanylate cyclase n=1 Tax=Gluconacetobacter tumulicola TaxID=1017177 RepID=A0A7W4JF76_9PROT|nr:GGDEF domain-containing protein [Gluconacetobacter tumulicola]MBB2180096.1 GGDEF domain-containing protein [Gluconacetobacter tumulicola]
MIDVDHFKSVNDTYGHPAGDEVLRIMAERLRAGLRPLDAVGRYGGEEFMALLTDIGEADSLRISERIRQKVAGTIISFDQHQIPVTCSIGVALSTEADSAETLIHRADQALYRAKQSGRNRVEISHRPH